jgi:hypothetical protein
MFKEKKNRGGEITYRINSCFLYMKIQFCKTGQDTKTRNVLKLCEHSFPFFLNSNL